MRLIDVSMRRSSLEFDPLGAYRSSNTSLTEANNPCEAHVHQQWRLLLMRKKPEELDRAFIDLFEQADFFWTGELFVACRPLHRVPERPRRERCEFHWIVPLDAFFGSKFQPDCRIVARFRHSPMKRKKLLRTHPYPVCLEQPYRKTCSPQYGIRREA